MKRTLSKSQIKNILTSYKNGLSVGTTVKRVNNLKSTINSGVKVSRYFVEKTLADFTVDK